METEKLEEAKKTFQEDQQKFKTYKEELGKKAQEITQKVNDLTTEKQDKMKQILTIKGDIQKVKGETKKIQEDLVVYVQQKSFLDELAEQSGLVKKKEEVKEIKRASVADAEKDTDTFLTQYNKQPEAELPIYFTKSSLLQRLQHMEEDNLFRIHLV
jgi:hypothetical protein